MQPLISPIDHESRTNSHRAAEEPRTSETSPLLQRFPRDPRQDENRHFTTFVISLLLIILLSGVVIGIYLLVIENRSENVLPPVEMSVRLVTRSQWDKNYNRPVMQLPAMKADEVIVVQTDTRQCASIADCAELLGEMQPTNTSDLPYNYLISSNGQTFEALGWSRRSPLFTQYSANTLVLAFIGNYTQEKPVMAQVLEAKNFLAEALSQERLESHFIVIGKRTNEYPTYLFLELSVLPQWSRQFSDTN